MSPAPTLTLDVSTVVAILTSIATIILGGYVALLRFVFNQYEKTNNLTLDALKKDIEAVRSSSKECENQWRSKCNELLIFYNNLESRLRKEEEATIRESEHARGTEKTMHEMKDRLNTIDSKLDRLIESRPSVTTEVDTHVRPNPQGMKRP